MREKCEIMMFSKMHHSDWSIAEFWCDCFFKKKTKLFKRMS